MRRFSCDPFGAAMREVSYVGKFDQGDLNTFALGRDSCVVLGWLGWSFEQMGRLLQQVCSRLVDTASNIAAKAGLKD